VSFDSTAIARRLLLSGLAAALLVLAAPSGALAAPAPSRWCGTDESSSDRIPDAVASRQLHVVYAIPSDGTDRFFERALPIARDLALVDTWWRQQDPTRTLRFDLHGFPGCDSTFGALDISFLRLPQAGTAYAALTDGGYRALVNDLLVSFGDVYKKYAVYYDGPIAGGLGICGASSLGPTEAGASFSLTFLNGDPTEGRCGSLGAGDYMAVTAVHEIIHNLGAVLADAPHQCEGGHVCDAPGDLMRSFGTSNSLFDYALDIGRDDYYGHSGPWWDVQDSGWLSHLDAPQFALAVSEPGSGAGRVESDLPGIACPPTCSIAWDSGTKLTLTATPDEGGSRFAGWTGACVGTADCSITMDAAKTVTAVFSLPVSISVSIASKGGDGRVASNPAGIDCPVTTCRSEFASGTRVVLTAAPDRRSRLLDWSVRACADHRTCTVTAAADTRVAATFGASFYRLTAAVQGQGRITSIPTGISCTKTCAASFPYARSLRLAAKPAKGWRFARWSGDCRGRAACVVKIRRTSLVRATFRRA
jgi:hypothetical protein